ncbi:putative cation/multidrug efflux pump [Candidatus Termititenax persephonae]|uniref:Cation/multidrug efflux pump n=1 Tax=Candidatus Termititenax persephonae TaxID=2218525 RepID=A0A388TGW0_9BACT|nr:putative cation/multidrug efflux pump [Candidatus Termititenax persephonae]
MVLFCGLGIFFLREQSIDMLPRIIYPQINVRVSWEGASPEEIETNITRRVETAVASAEDAIRVVSTVFEGVSMTNVYFDYRKDMEEALNDVRARMDRVNNLPDDASRPTVGKADPSQMPVLEVGFSSDQRGEIEMNRWADRELAEFFTGIPGLASITVSGGRFREIKVIFDPQLLDRYEIAPAQIVKRLAEENINLPGGYITSGDKELTVRLSARYSSLDDIKNVIIANREGVPLRLNQLAQVLDTSSDQRVMVRINQVPSVLLSFVKQPNANTVEVCRGIQEKITEFQENGIIPPDIKVSVVNNQSYYIANSIASVSSSLLFGGLLTVIVVFLFLRSFIRTFIVALAMPVSLLVTFFFMSMFGININMISLGGLVLGIGMLLDNSIVMLENITRHQQIKHEDILTAAEEGSTEIGSAVAASTLTNLASVLPFIMISGIAVLLFRDLIITISVAIIASLITALTVVPSLAARLTRFSRKRRENERHFMDGLAVLYLRLLKPALRFRWGIVLVLLALGSLTYLSLHTSGSEFLPQIDDGRINISVYFPQGTALHVTDALVRSLESEILAADEDIETLYSSTGGAWFGGNVAQYSNQARINIQLVSLARRRGSTNISIGKIQEILRKHAGSGAETRVTKARLRGLRLGATEEALEIKIFGPEIGKLSQYSEEVLERLRGIEGLTNFDTSLDLSRPELQIVLDRARLSNYGLSAEQVGDTVRTTLTGLVATPYSDRQYGDDFDIRVIYNREKFINAQAVGNILLTSPSGFTVRLGEVAQIEDALGPVRIERENQSRLVRVVADAAPGYSVGKLSQQAKEALADYQMPSQYRMDIGGELESMRESNQALFSAALLAVFLVFGIMAVQFESLRDPLVIMFTVPFAVMGAVFSLSITGTPFSTVVFLGIILLIGVAVNNGIVMVDYFGTLRRQGKSVYEAVLAGSPTRLRPVLMTSLTTIVGLLPMSLGVGEGSEMLVPLGRSVMGGMMLSFLLTLFVIPAMYLIFNGGKIPQPPKLNNAA